MIGTALNHLEAPPSSKSRSSKSRGTALAVIEVILAFVRVWRERGRTRCQLAAMSERELQDMGVCRSEVANEIGKSFWLA